MALSLMALSIMSKKHNAFFFNLDPYACCHYAECCYLSVAAPCLKYLRL